MKPESQLFKEEKSLDVTFPYTVTTEIVDKLIKTVDKGEQTYLNFSFLLAIILFFPSWQE